MADTGKKALRKAQLGQEATPGSAATPTTQWRGMVTLEQADVHDHIPEDAGVHGGLADGQYIPKELSVVRFLPTPLTFEQGNHVFQGGIHSASPSTDGVGTGKIYVYNAPALTSYYIGGTAIKPYSMKVGNNVQAEQSLYLHVTEFELSGKAGEPWMLSATWNGRTASKVSFTGGVTVPTVEPVPFSKTKLFIDAVAGTLGATQVSSTLLEASIKWKTGWRGVWTADGALYFTEVENVDSEIKVSLKYRHNTSAVAEKDAWVAKTPRMLRLKAEGSALATPGTTYTYKTFIADFIGIYDKVGVLEDSEGGDMVSVDFTSRYHATPNKRAVLTLVNELSAVP